MMTPSKGVNEINIRYSLGSDGAGEGEPTRLKDS